MPQFPLTIGIVTSPRGDAVHDMLRTLRNRFPVARVFVAGVQVEGAQARRQHRGGHALHVRAPAWRSCWSGAAAGPTRT